MRGLVSELNALKQLASRPQEPFAQSPYDQWVTADGKVYAEFFRTSDGFVVRFPGQADFKIDSSGEQVSCVAALGMSPDALNDLYLNSILPILGNHIGKLNLHGSATAVGRQALAFLGLSRRGKTTLVGACARAGYPFLTEDVLSLEYVAGRYWVEPKRPVLRVFPDSAAILLDEAGPRPGVVKKTALRASQNVPHYSSNLPLAGIYILGPGDAHSVIIKRLSESDALRQLLQHAFILDVEDRVRLRSHFERLADLVGAVPCHFLDYPRNFAALPTVVQNIIAHHNEHVR